jgi:hypothetical protein
MARLAQIIQNAFIRFFGLFYRLKDSLGKLLGFFRRLWQAASQRLGFSEEEYFLEGEEAKGIKRREAESDEAKPAPSPRSDRRLGDADLEYYRQLLRQEKQSS